MAVETMNEALGRPFRRHPVAALVVISLLAWLPGFFTLPPLDRDEARFAQASKQMLETGDFIAIRLGNDSRDQKPAGIYWLQAASTAVFSLVQPAESARRRIWTYRIPSLAGGIAALLLTFWLARAFVSTETAFLAALLLGMSLLLMTETKIAKTDAVLLATILGVQSILMRHYLAVRDSINHAAPSRALVLFGWAVFGFGLLVKGPIILLVCGATLVAISLWDRNWNWLKGLHPLLGIPIALSVALPWAIAIGIETGGAFFTGSLVQDFALKLSGGQETHGAPPGYYTLLVFVTFWPGTIVVLPALVLAFAKRREPAVRFLIVWAATVWLMFELTPTKLPHYVLPAYPALAILCAMWLTGARDSATRLQRIAIAVSPIVFFGVAAGLAGTLLWAPFEFGAGAAAWTYVAAAAGVVMAGAAALALWRGLRFQSVAAAALSAIIIYFAAWHGTAPALTEFTLTPRIAAAVARHRLPHDPPVVLAGYSEPSALFLLGTNTVLTTGAPAGAIAARQGGLAVVETNERDAFLKSAGGLARAVPLEEIGGIDYSNGRRLSLSLYRVGVPWR